MTGSTRRDALVVLVLLGVAFVSVAAWTWSWPDHPLIPDEAVAKVMVDSVAERGTPWAEEPFKEYRSGTFGADRYGSAYQDHELVRPPTSVAVSYEQGLVDAKAGRALTLLVGYAAVAFLGWRLAGPWGGAFAGVLFLAHPATLYFHQSYFANSGGTNWFLASLALLEASRRWWWLAPASAVAAAVAVLFRVEYAMGALILIPLACTVGPLRAWKPALAYYATVGALIAVLWKLRDWFPELTTRMLLTEGFDLRAAVQNPVAVMTDALARYRERSSLDEGAEWLVFVQHVNDYFTWFFPLLAGLAVLGLVARARDPRVTWVFVPLGAQSLLQAYAILPALANFDFSNVSWLESSVVRYFLVTYAFTALLAGLALSHVPPVLARVLAARPASRVPRPTTTVVAGALAVLLLAVPASHALTAEHGVAWANERKAWFDEIEAAAEGFGEDAVFVGKTPGKVIFTRPLMNPENRGWSAQYATFVATDLIAKDHRVFGLEPWFYKDHGRSIETILRHGDKSYWTLVPDVAIPGPEGHVATFFELHVTNTTLRNVTRAEAGAFRDDDTGFLRSNASHAFFYPERSLHVRMGLGDARAVNVTIEYLDEHANVTHAAGSWNLFLDDPRNEEVRARWHGSGSNAWRTASFVVPAGEIVNGPFFVGDDLLVRKIEVREVGR